MGKFGRFVRLRGTSLEGYITERLIHNGEEMFKVCWGPASKDEDMPLFASQLDPIEFGDTVAHDVIRRSFAHDRKTVEEDNQNMGGGSVEDREAFRSRTFQRI